MRKLKKTTKDGRNTGDKLTLNKESLRLLSEDKELERVAGAGFKKSIDWCPI
ncbi:MAG: hypothetical protein Tsb0020_11430 [Haliangiales bacterium]